MDDSEQHEDWLDAIERTGTNLTPWEEEFVEDMRDKLEFGGTLTERQAETLEAIYAKRTT